MQCDDTFFLGNAGSPEESVWVKRGGFPEQQAFVETVLRTAGGVELMLVCFFLVKNLNVFTQQGTQRNNNLETGGVTCCGDSHQLSALAGSILLRL